MKKQLMAQINIVPYIDVMLVLLVIFMTTTPLLTQGVKVELPHAQASALKSKKTPLVITVSARGEYFLNRSSHAHAALTLPALAEQVRQRIYNAAQIGNKLPVLVRGDRHVTYEKIVEAMVALQKVGVGQVGLMTEK